MWFEEKFSEISVNLQIIQVWWGLHMHQNIGNRLFCNFEIFVEIHCDKT